MRVQGNGIPKQIHIEPVAFQPGMVEIRLRENVREADEENTYFYDEYVFCLPDRPELETQIQNNLSHWLSTGRCREVKANASILYDLRSALNTLYQGVTE